ncbi:MAG: imidazolonepropionase [Pyrinomonadaceae bacterium]
MNADLIIHNIGQLVTCASRGKLKKGAAMQDVGIIENGAVAVVGGKIVSIEKAEEIHKSFKSKNILDAKSKVVCPAFVECHTHIVFAGNRLDEFELKIKGADYLEILAAGGGIISTVKQTQQLSLAELIEQSQRRLDKMLRLGVATCEVKTGYGLDTKTELKILEAIFELNKTHPVDLVPTFLAAHAVPPEYRQVENPKSEARSPDDYVDLICEEMIPKAIDLYKNSYFSGKQNLDAEFLNPDFFIDVFCEENAFTLEQSKKVLEAGKRYGMKIKAHVDEFTNLGAARMAIELGATSIDHLDKISRAEIDLLARSETVGVITPTVNFNFGMAEFADARKMIDAGCAIAVSTDYNPGSAPCPSLPNAMAIACRYQKLLPSEVLNAATINAAFAVGLGEKTGSIEVGKQADILILETDDYRDLAYEFGGNLVATVIKKGKII